MARVFRSERAQQDLEEILHYLDRQSTQAADRFAAMLDEKCEVHAMHPQLGESCEELFPNLKHFTVWNYAIFYRSIIEGIELVRVIHGARDLPRIFE